MNMTSVIFIKHQFTSTLTPLLERNPLSPREQALGDIFIIEPLHIPPGGIP